MNLPPLSHLAHANIITGNRQKNLELLKGFLSEWGIPLQANPDLFIFDEDQLLMEDAMKIVSMLSAQKVSSHRFCIVSCDRLATDVQNTLLKTMEEPQGDTHIMLLVQNTDRLLPTVLSRCQVIAGNSESGLTRLEVSEFLKGSLADRFAYVESWTKNKKDDDNVSKTEILTFVDLLEKALWEKGVRDETLFADIRQMRQYAGIRGGSHRVILDFLAMVAPSEAVLKKK